MKKNSLTIAVLSSVLLLAACNQQKQATDHNAEPSVAEQQSVAVASDAPASEVVNDGPIQQFTAYGIDQSWRVLIDGEQIEIEGTALPNATIVVERSAYAKGVEFMGQYENKPINLNINSAPCKDAQGTTAEFSVTLDYGDQTLKGCAVAGLIPTADT